MLAATRDDPKFLKAVDVPFRRVKLVATSAFVSLVQALPLMRGVGRSQVDQARSRIGKACS